MKEKMYMLLTQVLVYHLYYFEVDVQMIIQNINYLYTVGTTVFNGCLTCTLWTPTLADGIYPPFQGTHPLHEHAIR